MRYADEARDTPWHGWTVALVLLAIVIATRALWFGNPAATTDEQLYALIGAELANGNLPYLELWDRKPFGLFAIFAFAHSAGAVFGVYGPQPFQVLAAIFTFAGAWLTYLLARSQAGPIGAGSAGALYAIVISLYGGFSAQSEAFHAPLMLFMAWLVLDSSASHFSRRALLAMLVGGLALQVKYTVLPQCLFFGLVALWHLRRHGFALPRLGIMAATFAMLGILPTLAIAAFFAGAGALDAFWFANFESFFLRGGAGRFLPNVIAGAVPLFGFALGGMYLALRGKPLRDPAMYTLFIGWFFAALASVYLPGTVYLYYFGALAAPAILLALPLIHQKGVMRFVAPAIALAASIALLGPIKDWRTSREETASLNRLAAQIAPLVSRRSDCLWVHDGPAALYPMTRSCLPTRFIYPDHLNNALETDEALGISQLGEVTRILEQRPPVIVTSEEPLTMQNQDVLNALRSVLKSDYEELDRARSGYREVIAYARKD